MDLVARQPVGGGDQLPRRGAVAHPLQAGALEGGAAVGVIADEVLGHHHPTLLPGPRLPPLRLCAMPSACAWRWLDKRT